MGPQIERERTRRGLPSKIPRGKESSKHNEIITPLRGTLGIQEAPAMPCFKYELPKELKGEDGQLKQLSPPERWKYFHKTCKRRLRVKDKLKTKETEQCSEPLNKIEPRSAGGENFATSARLALNQELMDLDEFYNKYEDTKAKLGNHTLKEDDPIHIPLEYFCSVHTPVKNLRKIEGARDALDKEKVKLEQRGAWDLTKARPKSLVIEESKRLGDSYHFGKLMLLCHLKGSQLCEEYQSYKGRIVYCGNDTCDEDGDQAVFSTQGTQSSHLSAAKYVDAIARLPGYD